MVSMFNPRLTETLTDFPFARLNALIAPIAPPAHLSMINLAVGEPQGAMPAFARQIVTDEIDGWNKYPPNQGHSRSQPRHRRMARPALPAAPRACFDPAQHVIPTARQQGRRSTSSPRWRRRSRRAAASRSWRCPTRSIRPISAAPVLSGAEPLLVNANAETGFLPDFLSIDEATWDADGGGLSLLARQSAGRDRQPRLSAEAYRLVPAARRRAGGRRVLRRDLHRSRRRSARLEAALAMDTTGGKDPFRNVAVFHSLSKRSNAAGLRSGFMAGDPRLVAMLLRWRTYGGPQIPFAVQKASAALWREETHPLRDARVVPQELPRRRADPAQPLRLLHAGRRLLPVARRRRRRGGHAPAVGRGASQRCCPAPTSAARPTGINTAERYIRVALVHDEKTTREAMTRLAAVL